MLPTHHWANNFTATADDIEYLINLLLEKETPLSTSDLLMILLQERVDEENQALQEQFKDAELYNPANSYNIGQKLVFSLFDYSTATIQNIREGDNPQYGAFKVAAVQFEGDDTQREFAIELQTSHPLSETGEQGNGTLPGLEVLTPEEIMEAVGDRLTRHLDERLKKVDELVHVARLWFPKDLILEVNDGHLNLAEAVLDINVGGPLTTDMIVREIGGLGSSPMSLQVFSMNYALNADSRFDEVGPAGEVLWYLARMEPEEVKKTPAILQYTPIEHDRALLSSEMIALETEICDELSPIEPIKDVDEGTVTLIYPHRRMGTLPLNARILHLFPNIGRSARIWFTIVDAEDGEEFTGWLVPEGHYAYGFGPIYRKHNLPIGGFVKLQRTDSPGKIEVKIESHRARMEWVRLVNVSGDQLRFENSQRAIGAEYDDLMILGVDDLQSLDQFVNGLTSPKRNLAAIIRMIIPGLARLTPQGNAHATTIYSAVNMVRRCPPGPILAVLEANPDFENVGGHYWKLAEA